MAGYLGLKGNNWMVFEGAYDFQEFLQGARKEKIIVEFASMSAIFHIIIISRV